ncbi:MAG: hypothetical protein CBB68_11405 [Rhodospirillaceae bacterium TMED8]|nr:hypothetical protein [Magnetovibrio sp.]OUT49605.1 MAG: hypothetical protein CBB68_11405 [Rhodospirillaceae bacterium TMED8]|tara:strand:+ start:407 stop:826 length:420 start_codon:yes stop_codon:yes gene_type:complete
MPNDPVFINQFNYTPITKQTTLIRWWRQGWEGHMELWRVFWIYFIFGHGFVIGAGGGIMVITLILGFAVDPGSLNLGLLGLATGSGLLALGYIIFAIWSCVSIWRCASNCQSIRWYYSARGFVVFYGGLVLSPVAIFLA